MYDTAFVTTTENGMEFKIRRFYTRPVQRRSAMKSCVAVPAVYNDCLFGFVAVYEDSG